MSRVTITKRGKSFRCSAEVALAHLRQGAKLDTKDERGCKAFDQFMHNRPGALPEPKKQKQTKTK